MSTRPAIRLTQCETERTALERALRASEERHRVLFQANPLPLWVFDAETLRFVDVNDAACSKYGYRREEFLAMTVRDIRPPRDAARLDETIRDRNGRGDRRGEWTHRLRDGTEITVDVTARLVELGGRPAVFVCPVDVTETRRSEAALRESEERMRLLLESTSEAIYGVDPQGLCTFVNPACARLLGYASASSLIGKDMHALMHHSRADGAPYPREECRIYRAYRQGEGVQESGEVFWRADGTCFPAEYSSYPIRRDGRTMGAVVAFLDITERKAAERRMRELNADLERRVAERTSELEAANAELQAFDYSIAHDLRAPLTRMRGFATALLEGHAGSLEPKGRDYAQRIVNAAARMDELVGDLLQLSLVSRQELNREDVDVCALARSILDALAHAAPERRVEIALPDALRVRADARLLRIALENLLGNAWKFTSRTPGARIELGKRDGDLYVSDNGAGFDAAAADRLFTPFQRLHNQSEFEGTGIGLAIVHRIVQRHGGRISAESAPGRGATLRFSLSP